MSRPEEVEELGEDDSGSEDSEDLRISSVLDRSIEDGQISYQVQLTNGEVEWYDRSDLYDFGPNTMFMKEYDKQHPLTWDRECQFCGADFRLRSEGCEECRCDECSAPCRHINGVNYGCIKHPVI